MRSVGRLAVSLLMLCACNSAHTQTSTETGNPPVIDIGKIALVVDTDDVRIVGEPGAVKPGGAEVELAILGTDEVTRGTSRPDGSFSITIDAKPDAVVEVSAASGEKRSSSVYVTRGGAAVGSGKSDELTCMERSSLASQVLGSVLMHADASCSTAADCREVESRTSCTDSCGGLVVSASGVESIERAVDMIDQGVCGSFAADGCNVLALPCPSPPPGFPACVDGQCTVQAIEPPGCPSCIGQNVEWGTAMRTSHAINDCDLYQYTRMDGSMCHLAIPHCDFSTGRATLEDLIVALQDPAVQQALADEAVVGGSPNPGGLAPKVTVGGASFVVFPCGNDPSCMIPDGITRLLELLNRLASESGCL